MWKRIILAFIITLTLGDRITDLTNKKYVLTETDSVYLYENTTYLYHIANLTKILTPYENIVRSMYNINDEQQIIINKIEALKTQLIPTHYRARRSLNFLGSILKFVTGTPDHDDLIEIKAGLNQLITNNNQQRKINSQFEKILETLDPESISETIIINEVYQELKVITNTINFAKNGNFYSGTLSLNNAKEIIANEEFDLPIIHILEHSVIDVCLFQNSVITIYKYPIIRNKCKLFNVNPLAYKHGKLIMDRNIAQCNNKYKRVTKCKNNVGINICKTINEDNCTTPLLENRKAKCNIIQENNLPLLVLDHGNIITDGEHEWNGQKIHGPKLIQFNSTTDIDGKTFHNHQQEIKNVIHAHRDEHLEVLRILTSNSDYKFTNIQKMYKFIIPIEEHPIQFIMYCSLGLATLALLVYCTVKICQCYKTQQDAKQRELAVKIYQAEMIRLRASFKSEDTFC